LAFHPDFATNRRFFVNYTDLEGNTVVSEFEADERDANTVDPSSELIILTIEQPFANHNGGDLAFGPDGYLWIATGDGGGGGDPEGNGQNRGTLLGKLLRIDVDRGSTYTIPADNPFASDPATRDEIWALGLRNPWRFSFDRESGDLYVADVGQYNWEEVNFEARSDAGGRNYGWNTMEGSTCYQTTDCSTDGLALPVAEYSHSAGCSVTGGYVYRGLRSPNLQGVYLYGDFCRGTIWGLGRDTDGSWRNEVLLDTALRISSFGEGEDGELYLTAHRSGALYRITARPVSPAPRRPTRRVGQGATNALTQSGESASARSDPLPEGATVRRW
jgi:glucose/arabinose dehydrogenase